MIGLFLAYKQGGVYLCNWSVIIKKILKNKDGKIVSEILVINNCYCAGKLSTDKNKVIVSNRHGMRHIARKNKMLQK